MSITEEEIVEMNQEVEDSMQSNVSFIIQTKLLKEKIDKVESAINKSSDKASEKGIYLYVDHDTITLKGNNGTYGTETKIHQEEIQINKKKRGNNFEITGGEPGGAIILSSKFKSIINKLPRTTADVSIKKGRIYIESGSASFELGVLSHHEYIHFPDIDTNSNKISLHPEQLLDMYKGVSYAAAVRSGERPILTGVNHKIEGKELSVIATDAHQIGKRVIDLDDDSITEDVQATVPIQAINEVMKKLKDTKTSTVYFTETQVIFEFDDTVIYSRTLDGNYPDVSRLLPTDFGTEVRYSAGDLQDLLSRALILYEGTTAARVKIKPKLRQTRIIHIEGEADGYTEDIACSQGDGEDIELGANLRYLQEALKVQDSGDTIQISFVSAKHPFILRKVNGDSRNIHLILPTVLRNIPEEVEIDDFKAPLQMEADFDEDVANEVEPIADSVEEAFEESTPELVEENGVSEEIDQQSAIDDEAMRQSIEEQEEEVVREQEETPQPQWGRASTNTNFGDMDME